MHLVRIQEIISTTKDLGIRGSCYFWWFQGKTHDGRLKEGTYGIFSWIIMGLIVGALAKFLMPGEDPGGIFVTIVIGIAGGFIGVSLAQEWDGEQSAGLISAALRWLRAVRWFC